MSILQKQNIYINRTIVLLLTIILSAGCKNKYEDLNLSSYQYRDTKDLVRFVYDASLIVKRDGIKSIEYFKDNRKLFNLSNYYLYIYDMNGKNIYHAGMKHLEGEDLQNVTDKDGKKITQLVLSALKNKNNPHAWVHFSWWQPGKFYPVPKSSCHFKVTTPEGEDLYVGGGCSYPHEEKEFIRIVVDSAAELIKEKGTESLAIISDSTSQYNYRDVRVFAFYPDGKIMISPVITDHLSQIDLINCADEVGHRPFAKALKVLETEDSVWQVFMAKNRYKRELVKKCLYLKKTLLSTNEIYVGAITDLPQPPY